MTNPSIRVYTRRAQFLRYLARYLANLLRLVCVAWGLVLRLKKTEKIQKFPLCVLRITRFMFNLQCRAGSKMAISHVLPLKSNHF